MNRALVIIPTYNEVDNIERLIKRIFLEESFDVLVVDDSSPDGTADRVIELTPHFKNRLFLEGNHKKRGIGKAYLIGFEWALKRKYNFIFQIEFKERIAINFLGGYATLVKPCSSKNLTIHSIPI